MERVRRLSAFWNWLPAFRAVAELEHLPSAAEEFRVSASALSRSVRQLEEHLGLELFDREGRLLLNDSGRQMLRVLRRAMRIVDDGVESITSRELVGPVRIAARGSFASIFLVPAMSSLRREHPKLVPEVTSMSSLNVSAELQAGHIDLAVLDDPIPEADLVVERLAEITYGVYCGRGHPLFETTDPTPGQILAHSFVGPMVEQNDHWPPDVSRVIGARFEVLHHGLEVCAAGGYLAVLPDRVARAWSAPLRRLSFTGLKPTTVYAIYREPLGDQNRVEIVLDAMRRAGGA